MEAELYGDSGAYASVGAKVLERSVGHACGPYRVPNVDVEGKTVYTNNPPCGAMRGFGVTPASFALEVQMDKIAETVGMDPWEIRFINAYRNGDIKPHRKVTEDATLIETMQAAAKLVGHEGPTAELSFNGRKEFGDFLKQKVFKPGNAMLLGQMPVGTICHNVEMKPGKGGQIARAAGTYAQFVGRDGGYAQIRLSSGELRMVRQECMATVGAVSNPDNSNQNYGKAGRMRHAGKRPSVRGVVMNPIDPPHGGREGRTSGGRHPVNSSYRSCAYWCRSPWSFESPALAVCRS